MIRALLARPLTNLRRVVEDDTAVLTALRRSPKTPTELALYTCLDERRMYAAVDRLTADGLVEGGWVHSIHGYRWTYTTTTEETT